jgi:hypothetical protein
LKQSLKVKQTHKTYGYPRDKFYSIQHRVDYRNNQSGCLQISAAKSKVLKYLDDIENKLITEVGSVQEKNEEKINREKHEICQLTSTLKDNKQELEFLKDHGSNNQLFYLIRQGRVLCDNDPIVSMLTFLISLNSMSISLIAHDMS